MTNPTPSPSSTVYLISPEEIPSNVRDDTTNVSRASLPDVTSPPSNVPSSSSSCNLPPSPSLPLSSVTLHSSSSSMEVPVPDPSIPVHYYPISSPLTIAVSYRQRGNPLLVHLSKSLRLEFANIIPDYLLGPANAALFISLKYHRLNPEYLQSRISSFERHYRVRLLVCLVDLPDYEPSLERISYLAFNGDMSLFLAWSPYDAAKILQTFKSLEDKPPDAIQGRLEGGDMGQRASDVLTTISSVNKVDAVTLMREFGSLTKIMEADKGSLSRCPGIGPKKVKQLHHVFHDPLFE